MKHFEDADIQLINDFKTASESNIDIEFTIEEFEIISLYFFLENEPNEFKASFYLKRAIDQSIKLYPEYLTFRLNLVRYYLLSQKFDLAEKEIELIEQEFYQTSDLYLEKANLYALLERDNEIFPLIQKAYALDPEDPKVHFAFTYEYLKQHNPEQALKHLIIVLEHDIDFGEYLSGVVDLFALEKRLDEGIIFFKELSDHFPLLPESWINLATLYQHNKAHEEAIDALQFALVCDDQIGETYYRLGNCYQNTGRFEEAIEHYLKAIELFSKPEFEVFAPHIDLATCYDETGEYAKAIEYAKYMVNNGFAHHYAVPYIIELYLKLGDIENGVAFIEKHIGTFPFNSEFIFTMLEFYNKDEMVQEMIRLIEVGIKDPELLIPLIDGIGNILLEDELYHVGETLFAHFDKKLPIENKSDMFLYYYAAFLLLNHNMDVGYQILEDALLTHYEQFPQFLAISDDFVLDPKITSLIQQYKP